MKRRRGWIKVGSQVINELGLSNIGYLQGTLVGPEYRGLPRSGTFYWVSPSYFDIDVDINNGLNNRRIRGATGLYAYGFFIPLMLRGINSEPLYGMSYKITVAATDGSTYKMAIYSDDQGPAKLLWEGSERAGASTGTIVEDFGGPLEVVGQIAWFGFFTNASQNSTTCASIGSVSHRRFVSIGGYNVSITPNYGYKAVAIFMSLNAYPSIPQHTDEASSVYWLQYNSTLGWDIPLYKLKLSEGTKYETAIDPLD